VNITIIIPTLNESSTIGRLIDRLLTVDNPSIEILVVDGGSDDDTLSIVSNYGIRHISCAPSRAKQMNMGAKEATHNILYFVHADTLPPESYYDDCKKYLSDKCHAACYKSKFESKNQMLRVNEFFTRFYWLVSRGGDQSLFIRKNVFFDLGMFDEQMVIMEEYPLIEKLMENRKLSIIPKAIYISTRKYKSRSWLKVSRANYVAFKLFKKGTPSDRIRQRYIELLNE